MQGITAELKMERDTHKKYEDFGGCLICPYDVSKIEPTRRQEGIEQLRKNHHVIIHASKFGKSSVTLSN